jgi:hypothetical protein
MPPKDVSIARYFANLPDPRLMRRRQLESGMTKSLEFASPLANQNLGVHITLGSKSLEFASPFSLTDVTQIERISVT